MVGLIPLITLGLLTVVLWFAQPPDQASLRLALVRSFLIHGVAIGLGTELLSCLHQLSFGPVLGSWLLGLALIGGWADRQFRIRSQRDRLWSHIRAWEHQLTWDDRLWISLTVAILGLRLAVAIIAPPNNFDSMTYHLPRVMHWLQNHSVVHYPTANLRQISFPPGAAYFTLQAQLLVGSDRGVNLIQWLSWLGSVAGLSWLTRQLGGPSAQWIGALVAVSVPMAVLQGATTQTDLVTALWLVALACLVLPQRTYSLTDGLWIGACLGLAALTKPTGLLFSGPLLVVLAYRLVRFQPRIRSSLLTLSLSLGLALILPASSYWRNWQTFGHLLGETTGTINQQIGLTTMVSNALKLGYMNFPLPPLKGLILAIHQQILHLPIDDPATSYNGERFSQISSLLFIAPHEDFVGSPLHWLLGSMALVGLMLGLKHRPRQLHRALVLLALVVLADGLLFCLLLKWQPWGNRLIVGAVMLVTPVSACWLDTWGHRRWRTVQRLLLLTLAGLAILYGLVSIRNPILPPPLGELRLESILTTPRLDLYFDNSTTGRTLKPAYLQITQQLRQQACLQVGLHLEANDWEYPFWLLLPDSQLQQVGVTNISRVLPPEFDPSRLCGVIARADGSPAAWGLGSNWQITGTYDIPPISAGGAASKLRLYERLGVPTASAPSKNAMAFFCMVLKML